MAIDLTLESTTIAYGSRINTTMNKPTNTVDTNFLLAGIYIESTSVAITAPAGWTLIVRVPNTHQPCALNVYYKRASSEGANWTWTHTTAYTAGFVKRITGVLAAGDPEDCARSTVETDWQDPPVSNASITTATDGAALCHTVTNYYEQAWSASTLTERIDNHSIALMAALQAVAGASGAKTATTADPDYYIGVLAALKPEGGAPPASILPLVAFGTLGGNANPMMA